MEQAGYSNWIWAKRKNDYMDSWEERAFAVDAARYVVEDYTWPPRSYSCSFCSREFKSAQALGGHMNVHRRDRARLKQSPNPSSITNTPMAELAPLNYFSFMYDHKVIETSLPTSNINENLQIKSSKFSLEDSWSSFVQEKVCFCASDHLEINGEKGHHHELGKGADLSVNFDLVVECSSAVIDDEEFINPTCKRRRRILIDEPSLTSLFPKSSVEVMSPISNQEELDLELRLGDPPKVK